MVACPTDVHALHLPGREGHGRGAGLGEQDLWRRIAVSVLADLCAELGRDDTSGGREAEIDLAIGVLTEQFIDAPVVAAELVVVEFELVGERQRCEAVPSNVAVRAGQQVGAHSLDQHGGRDASGVSDPRAEPGHACFADERRRSRCRVVAQEGERGASIDGREQSDDCRVIGEQRFSELGFDHDLGLDSLTTVTDNLAELCMEI